MVAKYLHGLVINAQVEWPREKVLKIMQNIIFKYCSESILMFELKAILLSFAKFKQYLILNLHLSHKSY